MSLESRLRLTMLATLVVLPLIATSSIWIVELEKYHTSAKAVETEELEQLQAGHSERHTELDSYRYRVLDVNFEDAVATAARLSIDGVDLAGIGRPVQASFQPWHLNIGAPALRLKMAAGLVADLLLQAHAKSGEEHYLSLAATYLADLSVFERHRLISWNYLWNDHAISARILLGTRILSALAASDLDQPVETVRMLTLLRRDVELSLKPSLYTYRTNHGLMQDLAVLHAAVLVPALFDAEAAVSFVRARMESFLGHYVTEDGIVLEHSAGYHEFGVELLGFAKRYFELLNVSPPVKLSRRYPKSVLFYQHLLRPDGSLPVWGDTRPSPTSARRAVTRDIQFGNREFLSIENGAFIRGDGVDAHLFVQWMNFISGAHKHADEMSVDFWQGGVPWLRGVGYWPYGVTGRIQAEGWLGHNAPHLLGESHQRGQPTRLLDFRTTAEHVALHLFRQVHGKDAHIERQIVYQPGGWLVVVDSVDGSTRPLRAAWTSEPGVQLNTAGTGAHLKYGERSMSFRVDTDSEMESYKQDPDSILGWVGDTPEVWPALTLVTTSTTGRMAVVGSWPDAEPMSAVRLIWSAPTKWHVEFDGIRVARNGSMVFVEEGGNVSELVLESPPRQGVVTRSSAQSYLDFQTSSSNRRDYLPWRVRVSVLLVSAGIIGCLAGLLVRNWLRRSPELACVLLSGYGAAWILAALWLNGIYFA